jgi:Raf kinase inhibitor-like YbhB/YbcL family protein
MTGAATAVAAILAVASTMQLHSSDFEPGATLTQAFMAADCGGRNRSPELSWTNAPSGTKSFAVIMHDPDAPVAGGFYHWVVYNLPSSTHELGNGANLHAGQLGNTSLGKPGYYGPCPPPGPAHHYDWTVYALDVATITAATPLDAAQLEREMAGHVLARATLQAMAARH